MGGIDSKPEPRPRYTSRHPKVNEILKNIPNEMVDETLVRNIEAAYKRATRFSTAHSDIPAEPLVPIDE